MNNNNIFDSKETYLTIYASVYKPTFIGVTFPINYFMKELGLQDEEVRRYEHIVTMK